MNKKVIALLILVTVAFVSVTGVTAATAAGYASFGSIAQLFWDLFLGLWPVWLALIVLGIIDLATGGMIRQFLGPMIPDFRRG